MEITGTAFFMLFIHKSCKQIAVKQIMEITGTAFFMLFIHKSCKQIAVKQIEI